MTESKCVFCGASVPDKRYLCAACMPPHDAGLPHDARHPPIDVLAEALQVVKDRGASYGPPSVNHARTAALWSAYLGVPITPRQVCMLNILQKISRDANKPKRDNLVDVAGFAWNAEACDGEAQESVDA